MIGCSLNFFIAIFTFDKSFALTECTNKIIEINGVIDMATKQLFQITAASYSSFRKSYGINVTIKALDGYPTYFKSGLIEPINTSKTPIFVFTPYTVPKYINGVEFPFLARAIAMIYNLPGISNLNLTVRTISSMYNDRTQYWNDSRIAKYNPNTNLPYKKIITVARMDADISTAFITKLFKANDPNWNTTFSSPSFVDGVCCNSTTWQNTDLFGNNTVGIVGMIMSFPYSIGYVSKDVLSQFSVSIAGLLKTNENITYVALPTVENVDLAMYDYLNDSSVDAFELNSDFLYNDLHAYPLSAFSSLVLNYSYDDSSIDCCSVQELVGFIDWFYSASNGEYIKSLGFIPIIDDLTDRIKRLVLNRVQCSGELVYSAYLASLSDSNAISYWQLSLIVSFTILAIVTALLLTGYFIKRNNQIANQEIRWLLDPKRINFNNFKQIMNDGEGQNEGNNSLSVDTLKLNQSNSNTLIVVTKYGETIIKSTLICGEMEGLKIYLRPMVCKCPQHWSSDTKKLMNTLKTVLCRNVATLLGVTAIGPNTYAVYEYCAKGTLNYVLKTVRYDLTDDIKYHFALDIAEGLKYLHRLGIIHGYLSSITCYVDNSWVVKLVCWEKLSLYEKENKFQIKEELTYSVESMLDNVRFIQMLYTDPDILKNVNASVDVFSFGFLLLEIFTRKLPYTDNVLIPERAQDIYLDILNKKFLQYTIIQPVLQNVPTNVINLFNSCVAIPKETRPTMKQIMIKLNACTNVASVGIVDIVLDTLEKHADALEDKVEERTTELKKVMEDMKNLLNEVLPPQIATQLLAGNVVLPEHYECVTVYFSDIVGFTTISAMSSPTEVMALLNDLWIMFDNLIEQFDVYKVDTIGDAYMVCSGLPSRNGMNHCREIALLSLALRETCSRFKIKHLPNHPLNVRIGINSGPVTAGVVGLKMPQYCVFGDTVNTAARMESTSTPQKIQLSERSYSYLEEYFPGTFSMSYRGEISIKGKGDLKTYWLLDYNLQT